VSARRLGVTCASGDPFDFFFRGLFTHATILVMLHLTLLGFVVQWPDFVGCCCSLASAQGLQNFVVLYNSWNNTRLI
jgi:hypothetical protein